MAKQRNYLLGYGERLAEPVEVSGAGGEKRPPYSFEQARDRLSSMLVSTVSEISVLPAAACPNGQTVASFTLNPEYYAKSYFPGGLLRTAGLRAVGSRSRTITPEQRSPNTKGEARAPEESVTTELFVAGQRSSFERLAKELPDWGEGHQASKQLAAIERVDPLVATSRVKALPKGKEPLPLEVVLHANDSRADRFILEGFETYMEELGIEPDLDKKFFVGSLCFLRMRAPANLADQIARFSFLRVLREMPRLRTTRPLLRGRLPRPKSLTLPQGPPVDPQLRIAVFDGGLPSASPLLKWADALESPGIGAAHPELLAHGEAVTSALLFGSTDVDSLQKPFFHVDHHRVLDVDSENDPLELYDVLERVTSILDATPYEFTNFSIGPFLPVDDEDVHAWTAVLDERLSDGRSLAAIAAGNTGHELDNPPVKPWRVQVPSDCVNALTVGAANSMAGDWRRAHYSSRGPGRSPGIIKPDIVAFGGSEEHPFWVADSDNPGRMVPTAGTSFATPAALRTAGAIRAHFGSRLGPLAIKGLLIHATDSSGHPPDEVGWGKLPDTLDDLVLCPDTVARVVYQDEIEPSKYRRLSIPLPKEALKGMVHITATFCFATGVDPQHPGNYTRSGLEIIFRPHAGRFGPDATHPKSDAFFRPGDLYPSEQKLRIDAHKWETCLHRSIRKRATSLDSPVFDVHYNARSDGHDDTSASPIRYALIVTIEAPQVSDLYSSIVRTYRARLQPLRPLIEIPVRP